MNADLSEILRLLQNLIRLGTVAEVEGAKARVQLGPTLTTEWLKWITPRAVSMRAWSAPTVGEQVVVLSPGGDLTRGTILPAVFSQAFDAPELSQAVHTTHYPDGAVVQYDHDAHALTATLPGGTATITADKVTSNAPSTICTGDLTVMQNLIVKQNTTIEGATIRQFQQWGGAPVTVWRELRRIKEEMVNEAPAAMRRAWDAVQKIEGEKRACWAEYLRAQGGALVPRKELAITLAKDKKTVIGRYGETERITPYGVRCNQLIGVVFKSVRHTWTPVLAASAGVAVGVAVPRTRVNNCTQPVQTAPATLTTEPDAPAAPPPDLPDWAKTAVINAWAALHACPLPRLVVPDIPNTGEIAT